ncbi:hypothetical protein BOTBODRAFT_505496 [Botryobasidium botryosum FD-172 SS1]|uniref:Uncharacterized protein n=1 Tax=Botryobasidium botryosum (strain FD-172 SS1) TaxID=930990 RepID=A0A067M2A2_BOTB1|nr:hypothetical protein BOTBODRAFT_505496 [Botryobasidium botryosum FD-172 SS1]
MPQDKDLNICEYLFGHWMTDFLFDILVRSLVLMMADVLLTRVFYFDMKNFDYRQESAPCVTAARLPHDLLLCHNFSEITMV